MLKYKIHDTLYNWELNIIGAFYGIMASICSFIFSDFFIYFHWAIKQRNILLIQKDLSAEWLISIKWYK